MNLEIFSNSGYEIRVGIMYGNPFFVAKDIATALGYSDTQAMTRRLDDDEVLTCADNSSGQVRHIKVVNESGLYNAILGSQKQEGLKMKCNDNCVHGHISPSGTTLNCNSSACPVDLGATGMALLEDISIYKLKNCEAYKKHVPIKNQENSFTYQIKRD